MKYAFLVPLLFVLVSCTDSETTEEAPALVSIFLSEDAAISDTGGLSFEALQILSTIGGAVLIRDGITGSVLLVGSSGNSEIFTSADEVRDLTGESDVALGEIEQIQLGSLEGQLLTADAESGLLIRLGLDGTPAVHSTEAQITAVTGAGNARLNLPRALLANQIIVQDLITGDVLLIGNNGAPAGAPFVDITDLASAAGLPANEAIVTEWVQGGSTASQFARFVGSLNVVRVNTAGVVERWVEGDDLDALFPDITDLTILDLVADASSDDFLVLVGDGNRGVAIALVKASGALSVFTDALELAEEASAGYDILELGIAGLVVYGVDEGNGQLMTFSGSGVPNLFRSRSLIEEVAGTGAPTLSVASPLLDSAVLVFESTRNNILRIE